MGHIPCPLQLATMNERESRRFLAKLQTERQRKEAEAANATIKKPPATARLQKIEKRRSA